MNVDSELLDSLRGASRVSLIVLVLVVLLSLYMVQRAIDVATGLPSLLAVSRETQVNYAGLRFTFRTLTLLWPVVLGGLCLAYRALLAKRASVWRAMTTRSPEMSPELAVALDPLLLPPTIPELTWTRPVWGVAAYTPLVAVGFHILSVLWAVPMFNFARVRHFLGIRPLELVLVIGIAVVAAAFGLRQALQFRRAMRGEIGYWVDSDSQEEDKPTSRS